MTMGLYSGKYTVNGGTKEVVVMAVTKEEALLRIVGAETGAVSELKVARLDSEKVVTVSVTLPASTLKGA